MRLGSALTLSLELTKVMTISGIIRNPNSTSEANKIVFEVESTNIFTCASATSPTRLYETINVKYRPIYFNFKKSSLKYITDFM